MSCVAIVGGSGDTAMTAKRKRASTSAQGTCKAKPASNTIKRSERPLKQHKLPPDPDGLFKRAAARAKKAVAHYEMLNPDVTRDKLIANLVLDLICLSDRDPGLGDVDKECVSALQTYNRFVKENKWTVGEGAYP